MSYLPACKRDVPSCDGCAAEGPLRECYIPKYRITVDLCLKCYKRHSTKLPMGKSDEGAKEGT